MYSLSALCQKVCDEFGGERVPGSFAGPLYWRREGDDISLSERAAKGAGAFDWSAIDSAVEAVPAGKWTTYGDLAKLGGTEAMAVGQHMVAAMSLPHAYRVLGANGRPRPDFRWDDPRDTRSVVDVLREEGLTFTETGAADPSRRLDAAALRALVQGPASRPSDGISSTSHSTAPDD